MDGRELRVRYSVDMISNAEGRNPEALNSSPKRIFIYESPHKLYVGNLPWATKPEELRNLFTRFGTVVSVRVLHDRRNGKNRVFGFLSFSSDAECEAAFSLNGTVKSYVAAILILFLHVFGLLLIVDIVPFAYRS